MRHIWALEISDRPGIKEVAEPKMKFIAGVHGNAPVGTELLLAFAEFLCILFGKNQAITKVMFPTGLCFVFQTYSPGWPLWSMHHFPFILRLSFVNIWNAHYSDQITRPCLFLVWTQDCFKSAFTIALHKVFSNVGLLTWNCLCPQMRCNLSIFCYVSDFRH